MRALTPRERRLVAIGLLVGVVAAAWLILISPTISGFSARAAQRSAILTRYQTDQRLLDAMPALQIAAESENRTASAFQITAPSEDLAAEALKQRLAAALTNAGGQVNDAQRVQTDIQPGWVSVRADARINFTQFTKSLRQLENEAPYVVVEYASIGADQALRTGHAAPLDIRLEVAARFRPAPAQ